MNSLDRIPCHYVGRRLRWLGINVSDEKEKYGTWRVYCSFGLFYWRDNWLGSLYEMYNRIVVPIQHMWYRQVYRMALRKFPEEAQALLIGADWAELLMGLDERLVREQKDGYVSIGWEEQ